MSSYIKVLPNIELGKVQIRNASAIGGTPTEMFMYLLNFNGADGANNMYYDLNTDTLYFDSTSGDLSRDNFAYGFGFLEGSGASLYDPLGIITQFADNAFSGNTGENYLGGNIDAGNNFFRSANGTNTIYGINSCGHGSFVGYGVTMTILDNIGLNNTNDLGNHFGFDAGSELNVLASHQTSNGGGIEGDLALAIINGATVNFVL